MIPSPGTGTGSSRTYRLPERAMRIPYRNLHTRSHDLPYDRPVLQSIALPVVFQDRGTGSVLQGSPTGTDPLPVLWLWKCKTHFRGAGKILFLALPEVCFRRVNTAWKPPFLVVCLLVENIEFFRKTRLNSRLLYDLLFFLKLFTFAKRFGGKRVSLAEFQRQLFSRPVQT